MELAAVFAGATIGKMEKMPGVVSVPAREVYVEMLNQTQREPVQSRRRLSCTTALAFADGK